MPTIKNKKALIAGISLLLFLIIGSAFFIPMLLGNDQQEELTEAEQEAGVKEDVKIYDLIWKPVLYRGNVPDTYVQLSYVGNTLGKEEVLRIQNQRLVAQYGVETDFKKMTYGVALFSIRHNEPNSRSYVIKFKSNGNDVLLIQESLQTNKWYNFKILFNSETHQYRTYLNGKQLYEGRSYAHFVDYINGIEIYGGNNGYSLTYLSFESIIGYKLLEN